MSESQARPSFSFNGWLRLRTICIAMRQTEEKVCKLKAEIELKLKVTQKARDKKSDIEACQADLANCEILLELRKSKVRTISANLSLFRRQLGEKNARLLHFKQCAQDDMEKLGEMRRNYIFTREKIVWSSAQLFLRRKQLVQDLSLIFGMDDLNIFLSCKPRCTICKTSYNIAGVHLPDAENYPGHSDVEIAVALGHVAHFVGTLSKLLDIPLRYPVLFKSSKSFVIDHLDISASTLEERRFPLFSKGQDKTSFQYAVFLLNKSIAQLRYDCVLLTDDLRQTIANLRSLISHLINARIDNRYFWRPTLSMQYSCAASSTCSSSSLVSEPTSDLSVHSKLTRAGSSHAVRKNSDQSASLTPPSMTSRTDSDRTLLPDAIITSSIENDQSTAIDGPRPAIGSIVELDFEQSMNCDYLEKCQKLIPHNKSAFIQNCTKLFKTCYLSSERLDDIL